MCGLVSAMAEPGEVRVQTNEVAPPSPIMPISAQEEPHASPPLRDMLRMPYGEQRDAMIKPYRLSAEERHRLREQLRGQAEVGFIKDKP